MDAIKSLDSRTIWTLTDEGELNESGGDTWPQITRSAIDTEILLTLLKRNEETIHKGADKERSKLYGTQF